MLKPGITRAVLMANGHRCQYCGKPATTADHIIPTALGGSDKAANLTASCKRCNCSKGARRLDPAHEQEIKTQAWIVAGLVEEMTHVYRAAVTRSLREARSRTRAPHQGMRQL